MGIEGLGERTVEELQEDIAAGGRFVVYFSVVSVVILTFKEPTAVRYVDSRSSRLTYAIRPTLVSLAFGWWGLPWGVLSTLEALVVNLVGGQNVSEEVMRHLARQDGSVLNACPPELRIN